MATLLYLVHRMPYPPDKGDKVRSYHLLRYLAARHRVFVGTFVDDPDDERHVDTLRSMCAGVHVVRLHRARATLASLGALLDGTAMTLRYYRNAGLRAWVESVVAAERIDAAVVFSSSMAQYAEGLNLPTLIDFVDVDSMKWSQYAERRRWPISWLYRREGARLLAYERSSALQARRAFFVTEKETELFRTLAPECARVVEPVANGVDADHFAPDPARPSPYPAGAPAIVFTGAMDYWPNVDAVTWFVRETLPRLLADWPGLRFHIVGRNPSAAVRALAGPAVNVTGTVPDVRPWLQHADVVVAPLRLARGIQNKILEAMAMARPVVASTECGGAIDAEPGRDLALAAGADAMAEQVAALLRAPQRAAAMGAFARRAVQRGYSWDAHLAALDRHLLAA